VLVEPKKASVAVHYRLADETARRQVELVIQRLLAARSDELKVTPGKMVYELQPKRDWNKGRAVLYLLDTLGLTGPDLVPMYLGDDVTDEDAFQACAGAASRSTSATSTSWTGRPPPTSRSTPSTRSNTFWTPSPADGPRPAAAAVPAASAGAGTRRPAPGWHTASGAGTGSVDVAHRMLLWMSSG